MKNENINIENAFNIDLQMCFALYSASLSMTKAYKPLLNKIKLTYPQYLVLLVLWEKQVLWEKDANAVDASIVDGLSVSELSERLFSDSGTLTPMLKRLEKLGYLQRQRSSLDERRVMITLTEAGRLLRDTISHIPQSISCSTGCSMQEINALNQQLITLRTALISHLNQT